MEEDTLEGLKRKAAEMRRTGRSTIAGGKVGEQIVDEWERDGVGVRKMPDDEHGILRISIGGGETSPVNYCVFRGDRAECVELLRKALAALENR